MDTKPTNIITFLFSQIIIEVDVSFMVMFVLQASYIVNFLANEKGDIAESEEAARKLIIYVIFGTIMYI